MINTYYIEINIHDTQKFRLSMKELHLHL